LREQDCDGKREISDVQNPNLLSQNKALNAIGDAKFCYVANRYATNSHEFNHFRVI